MEEDLRLIEKYAGLEGTDLHRDFEAIVSDIMDARDMQRSFTSSQLPEGFVSETLEGGDFGFYAEKTYEDVDGSFEEATVEVEYEESTDIGFGSSDSSRVTVSIEPAGYEFREAWDQNR